MSEGAFGPRVQTLVDRGWEASHNESPARACRLWFRAWSRILEQLDEDGLLGPEQLEQKIQLGLSLADFLRGLFQELTKIDLYDHESLRGPAEELHTTVQGVPETLPVLCSLARGLEGRLLWARDQEEEALAHFQRWLEEEPNEAEVYLNYCQYIEDTGEALDLVRVGIERCSDAIGRMRLESVLRQYLAKQGKEPPQPDPASSVPAAGESTAPSRGEEEVGRNDPCPCGSGRKHKRCCW